MKRLIIDINDQTQISQNTNEISIFKQLHHLNLIQYINSFYHKEKLCIIMEYADDGDLYNKIKAYSESNTHIPENLIWNWLLQLCSGLHYLHNKKIIHRDIKCQNIFMMKNGTCKLGDFGISKKLKHTNDFACTSLGTPFFLSPEICSGKAYNFKSDMWMVGCVLYEMMTLSKPFDGENLPMLMNNILTKDIKKVDESVYSKHLCNLVYALLDKNWENRPSINEVINMECVKEKINELKLFFMFNDNVNGSNISTTCGSVCNTNSSNNNSNSNQGLSPLNAQPKTFVFYCETDENAEFINNNSNLCNNNTNNHNGEKKVLRRTETKQDDGLSIPKINQTPMELLKSSKHNQNNNNNGNIDIVNNNQNTLSYNATFDNKVTVVSNSNPKTKLKSDNNVVYRKHIQTNSNSSNNSNHKSNSHSNSNNNTSNTKPNTVNGFRYNLRSFGEMPVTSNTNKTKHFFSTSREVQTTYNTTFEEFFVDKKKSTNQSESKLSLNNS